jgi:hypothetical protein
MALGHQYMTLIYQINDGSRRLIGIVNDRKESSLAGWFEDFGAERNRLLRHVETLFDSHQANAARRAEHSRPISYCEKTQ